MARFDLGGRRVLVTGAGGGLGQALADGLSEQGATVYGTSRDPAVAREISKRYGTPELLLDVQDVDSLEAFVESLDRESGGIDMLVNNAGLNIPKPAVDVTLADWQRIQETNVQGPFFLSTAFARLWMRDARAGAILNIASQAGLVAIEDRAPYGSSKAALIHLTKVLALEWASNGIRVNAIAPTFILTEMTRSTLEQKEWADKLLGRIPLGRFGDPEDIVGAAIYLLSDESALVTGQTIVVDGGYTLH
jgi:NAD(P)-dependent dehydrogenase (short-subunit alcohol dehydrogenase family)